LRSGAVALCLFTLWAFKSQEGTVLDGRMHHLGNDTFADWPEASPEPEGMQLEFSFEGEANPREVVLATWSRNIDDEWWIEINGQRVATCERGEDLAEHFYPIAAGTLVDGTNRFVLRTNSKGDDITFGRVRRIDQTFRELFHLGQLAIRVTDADNGAGLPVRITIADAAGKLVPLYSAEGPHRAVRPGVLYTDSGSARRELSAGTYTVYATRGMEWGLDQAQVTIGAEPAEVSLAIRREVDTTGYVAADTHIHTLTFSGHGDSSVEERMVTLAGEGVELAIATDHNHNTNYEPYQQSLQLGAHFTTVVGNEVTTPVGHFNAFPLDPAAEIPPHELRDFVELVDGMRAKGAQVVILNHPRWPNHEEGPFGVIALDPFTGAGRGDAKYPFDAMELVNSCTEEHDPLLLFTDWFSLLNRGEHVVAVGSSDSHTVGEPVGGGRTYVPNKSDDPSQIDVDAACQAIAQGRTGIAMGIFATATAKRSTPGEETFAMGDSIPRAGAGCEVTLQLQAPAWIRPMQAVLFVNGHPQETIPLSAAVDAQGQPLPTQQSITRTVTNTHGQDAWVVWVVTGAGIDGPYWPLTNDYTLGATNPIYLDFDGDGAYQSPRATAAELVQQIGSDPARLTQAASESDEAVAFHLLDLAEQRYLQDAREKLRQAAIAAQASHPRIGEYLKRGNGYCERPATTVSTKFKR
ncbi:MAG: PHP domain-containing protein, partial [Planctomycetes bacterium]|nr:PHP domain-containing protein [Planctomycetota bacterium]